MVLLLLIGLIELLIMNRYYYSEDIGGFLEEADESILGKLAAGHEFKLEEQQRNAWKSQIRELKGWLKSIKGHILFEYTIPRMGKRIDCVIIAGSGLFVIEFKVGTNTYRKGDIDQVVDYALDLKNFHKESHNKAIIPVLVCTEAKDGFGGIEFYEDGVAKPLLTSGRSLSRLIEAFNDISSEAHINVMEWINSGYQPTPTIIEAAQALYQGHGVEEISRSDSDTFNLTRTSKAISAIIEMSKRTGTKSICFLTGVPGAGKTLAGLNLANACHDAEESKHAVFLSGNGPLVKVLREALARDDVVQGRLKGERRNKSTARRKTESFIQNIHHFRDEGIVSDLPPTERVVVFDEAQRAWSAEQTSKFMKSKKGIEGFSMSEPEFLISYMNRHDSWSTIVCLIGSGQEINKGEAGLREWFSALDRSFKDWSIFVSSNLVVENKNDDQSYINHYDKSKITYNDDLQLSVSIRSFRSEKVSEFVRAVLDCDDEEAKSLFRGIKANYPIRLTRDLAKAKQWIREKARGTERYGVIASSGAARLRPEGINVKAEIDPENWFLNDSSDVRSSYFMEEVATEFDIQGLELDWAIVGWDANLRYSKEGWDYKNFTGTKWNQIRDASGKTYLKNAYRVLLTRSRQGMVIYIPYGDHSDITRLPQFYDTTYLYLRSLGIDEI